MAEEKYKFEEGTREERIWAMTLRDERGSERVGGFQCSGHYSGKSRKEFRPFLFHLESCSPMSIAQVQFWGLGSFLLEVSFELSCLPEDCDHHCPD